MVKKNTDGKSQGERSIKIEKHSDMTVIEQFYHAFTQKDADAMVACYADNVVFTDPAFGTLEGDRAKAMWQMLNKDKNSNTKITYEVLEATENNGKVYWEAKYEFGPKKRKVHNKINATLVVENGKIVKHTDVFNSWKWAGMVLGVPGHLLGWTPFMKRKIKQTTNKALDKFIEAGK